ncbi:MAG: radical SAM protein [Elusimicrobiales bacterium]|nr:radical SAM protein [Elusimicrobiales bacterium]
MKILLVEPSFPYPNKSKNKAGSVHKNFVPLGLLKLGKMHRANGDEVKLVRGNRDKNDIDFVPDEVLVTSLFTYWSKHVWDSIDHYRGLFPKAKITLGGIYATLFAKDPKFIERCQATNVTVFTGIHPGAEKHYPDYSLISKVEYHATHMMRGCMRKCAFCGTWRIEPERTNKSFKDIELELKAINKNKIVFYDNNILDNPDIKQILQGLSELRIKRHPVVFESQSGFDGRLLENIPELALLLRKARFRNIRIAWDGPAKDKDSIKRQLDLLVNAGYKAKDISVFMIYNFEPPYEGMVSKLEACKEWGVQITDCRYRPLTLDYDNYSPHMRNGQPEGSFYIHKKAGWTDENIRLFRHQVREHNIWVRYAMEKGLAYDKKMERWSAINNTYKYFNLKRPPFMSRIEESPKFQERIKFLTRIKHHHIENKITPPDLRSLKKPELDRYLLAQLDYYSLNITSHEKKKKHCKA